MTPEIPKGLAPIPKGWEACCVGQGTHAVLATGDIHELEVEFIGIKVRDQKVNHTLFKPLGITPIRKVEPIEFTVEANRDSGYIYGTYALYPPFQYGNLPEEWIGKTFREVIE